MDVQSMFRKPEIPVEVRVPDALMDLLAKQGQTASRALKLGIYALLCAEEERRVNMNRLLTSFERPKTSGRRVTLRVPVRVYDEMKSRIPDLTVSEAFSRIAVLYEQHTEALEHV